MKKALMLLLILLACAVFLANAQAQNQMQTAHATACDDNSLDTSLRARIVLESRGEGNDGLLSDVRMPGDEEGRALKQWFARGQSCRIARAARITAVSPAAAQLRRTLDTRNGKILDDLVLRKISYGTANRQWANAELDFNRLYANALSTRVNFNQPDLLSLPPQPSAVTATDQAVQQQQQMNADAQRMNDDAMKARNDAARPALCPSNPAGLPGPAPDPVGQPFC